MKPHTLLLVILILGNGCATHAPIYSNDPTVEAVNLRNHPLTSMNTEEANAFIAGHFWNGDYWLNRNLDLEEDMTFHYNQKGPIDKPAIMPELRVSSHPDRYPQLNRNFDWELKGTWSLIRNKGYVVRLDITESNLFDTAESLPPDAFLQLWIELDNDMNPINTGPVPAPEEAPKRADGIVEIKLAPTDHSPGGASIHTNIFDTNRWPFPLRTFRGRKLIRQ